MKRYPRILYFIKGTLPSAEAQEIAETMGPNVAFRNANFVQTSGAPERCDGVAGEVPELYNKFPSAEEALKKFEEERKASIEKAKEGKAKREEQKAQAEAEAAKKAEEQAKADAEKGKQAEANKQQKPAAPAQAAKGADWKPNA